MAEKETSFMKKGGGEGVELGTMATEDEEAGLTKQRGEHPILVKEAPTPV